MKVEQKKTFDPVVITLESNEELQDIICFVQNCEALNINTPLIIDDIYHELLRCHKA